MKILLLDREWEQTAYLVVCLARAGIEVILVSGRPPESWGLGRYCRLVLAPNGIDDLDFLKTLLSTEQVDMVLPLCETTQWVLWDCPAELTTKVFPQTNSRQRGLLSDRRKMYEMVGQVGVPAPTLTMLEDEQSIATAAQQLGYPMVLRGTQGLAGDQVRIVRDAAEAFDSYAYLRQHSPEPPFAQAFIDGQRYLVGGLFDRGRMLQSFSQTTIEASWATGPSLRVRSVRDPVLTGYAERVFAELGWSGLACAEFIRNKAGQYFFLEVNPRPWAAVQAAHYCGVPLLKMFAEYLLGREPKAQVDFPDGKEVTLFPKFVAARLDARRFGRWSDRRAYLQALRGAPWMHPPLMLHFIRNLWWAHVRAVEAATHSTAVPESN